MNSDQVYIAAPWVDRDRARVVSKRFEEAGFEITEKWWDRPESTPPAECAAVDLVGIYSADVFVLLNTQPKGFETSGKQVEFGVALELELPIILIGERTNVFHYLDEVTVVGTVEDAIHVARQL